MQACADIRPPASVAISVKSVVAPNPRYSAPPAKALHLKLNSEAFRLGLATHGNQDCAERIVKGYSNGVSIGYERPRFHWEYNNSPFTLEHATDVQDSIATDIYHGIKAGPYFEVSCDTFVGIAHGLLSEEALE